MSKPPAAVRPWPPSAPGRRQPQPPAWQAILVVCLVDRQPARFVWKSLGYVDSWVVFFRDWGAFPSDGLNQDFEFLKCSNFFSSSKASQSRFWGAFPSDRLNQDFEFLKCSNLYSSSTASQSRFSFFQVLPFYSSPKASRSRFWIHFFSNPLLFELSPSNLVLRT